MSSLGILGGGQLARMLAESAIRQGIEPVVLAASETPPARIPGVDLVHGPLDDAESIGRVFARSRWVTVENEFLDLDVIGSVMEAHPEVHFRPGRQGIGTAQDKLAQKKLFGRLDIATPDFEVVRVASLDDDLGSVRTRFPEGFVLKWSRFGYDGRGNLTVRPGAEPSHADIESFCTDAEAAGGVVYAEAFVDFALEVAMVSTRAVDGHQLHFPLVVSRQERGVCRDVAVPAVKLGVEAALEVRVAEVMTAVGTALDMCGTFAMEFFVTRDGELLVNEMAPRVHNTGHYTLFGDEPSQFDLHVQAVTGRTLTRPDVRGYAAMRNFLGPFSLEKRIPCPVPTGQPPAGCELYWYHKDAVSRGRKMGHVTGRAGSPEELEEMLQAMERFEQDFWTETKIRES